MKRQSFRIQSLSNWVGRFAPKSLTKGEICFAMSPRSGEPDSKLLLCVKALSPASWLAHYSSFGIYAKMLQTNSIFNSNLNENIKSKTKLGIFIQNNSGWHSSSGIYAKKLEKNFAPARNVEFADERTFERSSPHSWWIWITKQNIAGAHLIKTQPIGVIIVYKKQNKNGNQHVIDYHCL